MPETLVDRGTLEKLERLALYWRRSFHGLVGGYNHSRLQGYGQEFLDHRNFHPGDDLRAVNWRAYLRFERFLLKTFQLEPRVPIRLLLDASASMAITPPRGEDLKFHYACQLALALVYIGLVKLDSIVVQPFASALLRPIYATGGRQRINETEAFLRRLKPGGQTDFAQITKQFLLTYGKPGLVIVVSDFFSNGDALKSLQALADVGHELLLVQLWNSSERHPDWTGSLELVDCENGERRVMQIDEGAKRAYERRVDEYSQLLRQIALRNKGRFVELCTRTPVEEALFGPIQAIIGRN